MQNETMKQDDQFLILQNRIKAKGLWEAYQVRLNLLLDSYKNGKIVDTSYLYLFEEATRNFGRDIPLN